MLFVDDWSRFSWIYPLHTKDQALSTFIKFQILVEKQFDAKIKCLQLDNGGEFKAFASFLTQQGIVNQCSCPHILEQNGITKRKIRHIVETGLTLVANANLPSKFWL